MVAVAIPWALRSGSTAGYRCRSSPAACARSSRLRNTARSTGSAPGAPDVIASVRSSSSRASAWWWRRNASPTLLMTSLLSPHGLRSPWPHNHGLLLPAVAAGSREPSKRHLCQIRHHRGFPPRLPHDIDRDGTNFWKALANGRLDRALQVIAQRTGGCCHGHRDAHLSAVRDLDAVDQAQVHDIHAEFGIVHEAQDIADLVRGRHRLIPAAGDFGLE